MQRIKRLMLLCVLTLCACVARADDFSFTGTFVTPETPVFFTLGLSGPPQSVTLQTYGFGGGTNVAGTSIPAGGTDDFVGIFSGTGPSAAILTDGSGNPYGDSLYLGLSFPGCPPATAVSDFGDTPCGDERMKIPSLPAGVYTIVLSDGNYFPAAAHEIGGTGTLADGFFDFTGAAYNTDGTIATPGQFCNIFDLNTGKPCPANAPTLTDLQGNGAWALDILTSGSATVTPEPGTLLLLGTGLLGIAGLRKRRSGAA